MTVSCPRTAPCVSVSGSLVVFFLRMSGVLDLCREHVFYSTLLSCQYKNKQCDSLLGSNLTRNTKDLFVGFVLTSVESTETLS